MKLRARKVSLLFHHQNDVLDSELTDLLGSKQLHLLRYIFFFFLVIVKIPFNSFDASSANGSILCSTSQVLPWDPRAGQHSSLSFPGGGRKRKLLHLQSDLWLRLWPVHSVHVGIGPSAASWCHEPMWALALERSAGLFHNRLSLWGHLLQPRETGVPVKLLHDS